MQRTTEISIVVRGEIVSCETFHSDTEAERYKAAIRRWGAERAVMLSILTRIPAAQEELLWLLPAQAS